MDEPLSNLDAKLRESLRSELKDLQTSLGATFLFVTHDQIEAMSMGDRIGVLNEGRLVQVGTPNEIYNAPRRHLRRDLRRLAGDEPARRASSRTAGSRLPGGLRAAARAGRAGAPRPRRRAGDRRDPLRGHRRRRPAPRQAQVHHVENHGVELVVTLRAGDALFKATAPAGTRLTIDETVPFALNQERLHGFDATTGRNLASAA